MRGPILSAVVAGVLLVGATLAGHQRIDRERVDAYHASIREAVVRLPVDFGVWAGHEVQLPPSATKLLRPNAIVAREYTTPDHGGLSATLLVVQCADIRDMQGHFPPNCYPAHGWAAAGGPRPERFGDLDAVRYNFTRPAGNDEQQLTVFNLFILPTGRTTTSMDDVRDASSDYVVRPYGAAQIQVVLGEGVPESEQPWVLGQMRAIAEPVIQTLLSGAPELVEGGGK